MKNLWKIIGVLMVGLIVFTACSKDDDPADNDLFVGTYKGTVSFLKDGETKSVENGSVTVAKVGGKYNFAFSDGIDNITGVEFKKEGDNTYINIGGSDTSYIRIDASTLKMLYIKDGKTWTANCTR